jgi:outer membrane protein
LFGELNANYAGVNTTDDDGMDVNETKYNGFNFGFAPGVNYFLTKNFALEATVGVLNYTSMKEDTENAKSIDNFNIGLNFTDVSLGLVYKF